MFVKRLAQKLSAKRIRAYSIDPGGMSLSPSPQFATIIIYANALKWIQAVQSGLQRHVTPEMGNFIEQSYASGQGMCWS